MNDNNANRANLIDIDELCIKLNLKESRLRWMVFTNKIPYLKIGRSVRFDLDEINSWLNKKRKEVIDDVK
jgi:excisionase family DNA binding protein